MMYYGPVNGREALRMSPACHPPKNDQQAQVAYKTLSIFPQDKWGGGPPAKRVVKALHPFVIGCADATSPFVRRKNTEE